MIRLVWSKYGPDYRSKLDRLSIERDEYEYYMTYNITPFDILDDYYDEYVCGNTEVVQHKYIQARKCLKRPLKGGIIPDGYFEPCYGDRFWRPVSRNGDMRSDPRYDTWRLEVFKRDDFTCQTCGAKTNLEAHHIKQVIFHPHLIYDIDNGVTLCHDCHREIPVLRRSDLEEVNE